MQLRIAKVRRVENRKPVFHQNAVCNQRLLHLEDLIERELRRCFDRRRHRHGNRRRGSEAGQTHVDGLGRRRRVDDCGTGLDENVGSGNDRNLIHILERPNAPFLFAGRVAGKVRHLKRGNPIASAPKAQHAIVQLRRRRVGQIVGIRRRRVQIFHSNELRWDAHLRRDHNLFGPRIDNALNVTRMRWIERESGECLLRASVHKSGQGELNGLERQWLRHVEGGSQRHIPLQEAVCRIHHGDHAIANHRQRGLRLVNPHQRGLRKAHHALDEGIRTGRGLRRGRS